MYRRNRGFPDTPEGRRQANLDYEREVRERVPEGHKWFAGWTNWFETPPPANVPVEYMVTDGRRYGVKAFEDPANTWYSPVAAWWWRIPPAGLYYNPANMPLDTFLRVRADLGPHEATEVWNEAHREKAWFEKSLPYESAIARIQRGELVLE
jgi:hypothetical protein